MISGRFISLKYNGSFLALVLIAVCLFLILLPLGFKERVSEISIEVFYTPFSNIEEWFSDLYGIREKARELEKELIQTRLRLSYYEDAIAENRRLRQFLDFSFFYHRTLLPAEIIKRSDQPHTMSILINIGKESGLAPDMAAITPEGLAGRVIRVYDKSSEIQLLLDPSSRVSAIDTRSRVHGILKYRSSRGLILDNIPGHEDIAVGDTIKTSGLGGVYPSDIPIGVISEIVILSSSYLFAEISVEPFTDFGSIERIYVISEADE
jgi:rod shape-determining protein MreC